MDIRSGDALVMVDVQNDFLPGGTLAVPDGDAIVPVLNRWIEAAQSSLAPVFATRDWHPPNHCSFRTRGGPWPPHCVQGTWGAEFAPQLKLPASVNIVSSATDPDREAYSGFQGTDLAERLRALGASRLLVGGLATDYCVLETVQDALAGGFQVLLLLDAIRAIDVHPGDGARAELAMTRAGAIPFGRTPPSVA